MATASNQGTMTGNKDRAATQGNMGQNTGSPISNEAYDVITALQAKLEGLEAYRKYVQNGNDTLWKEMTQADIQCVDRLVDELERLVRDGKLRIGAPGRGNG